MRSARVLTGVIVAGTALAMFAAVTFVIADSGNTGTACNDLAAAPWQDCPNVVNLNVGCMAATEASCVDGKEAWLVQPGCVSSPGNWCLPRNMQCYKKLICQWDDPLFGPPRCKMTGFEMVWQLWNKTELCADVILE